MRPTAVHVGTGDAGQSWVGIPAPRVPLGDGGVRELRFADPRDGFAFGDVLAVTHDAGAHWHQVELPVLAHGQVTALAADAGSVYAFVVPTPGRTGFGVLYRSPVGRDDFAPVPGTRVDAAASGQLVLAGVEGWLAVATPSTAQLLGTDSGRWTDRTSPCTGRFHGPPLLASAGGGAVVGVCGDGVAAGSQKKEAYLSADGARHWRHIGTPPLSGDLADVGAAGQQVIVVGAASGAAFIHASFDGGQSWLTVYQRGVPMELHDLGFTTDQQGVAVQGRPADASGKSLLLITRDGGHSWSPVDLAS